MYSQYPFIILDHPVNTERNIPKDNFHQQPMPVKYKWVGYLLTLIAILLYAVSYFRLYEFRQLAENTIGELSILSRVVLNIYQPFLIVFILITIALVTVLNLGLKRYGSRHKVILILIAINCLFSAVLSGVSFIKFA